MTLEVRRIVTGHDAQGQAIVTIDEVMKGVARPGRGNARCDIWSTPAMPVDNSGASEAVQREAPIGRYNYVDTGQGTVIRITEFEVGAPIFMHRTETLDYAILLSGSCDLELDSGETVRVEAGDVVVQRGTMHAWVNRGAEKCRFAFILIDAAPVEVQLEALRTFYPTVIA